MTREGGGVGIGARLRAARERKGQTVLQAAEKLHVDARILEALEAENFEPLGADVYARGHLRRYAELIGESPAELQELYTNTSPQTRPDLTRIPRGERAPESARLMLPALLAVIGLTCAGLVWWLLTLPGAKPHPLPPPATPAATVSTDVGTAAEAPAPSARSPVAAQGTVAAPGMVARPAAAVPAESGPGQTLTLKFSGDSWVQITDARGRTLLDGLQPAGSTRAVTGAAPLRVVLGYAPVVALEVNGRAASFAGLVRRRGDAHLSIDASGAVSAAASPPERGE
jgi:cytoskeleton protein RodZ